MTTHIADNAASNSANKRQLWHYRHERILPEGVNLDETGLSVPECRGVTPMSDTLRRASGEDSIEPLNVPHLAAGTFMIQSTGTEVLLILQSARSLADKNTGRYRSTP